MGRISISCLFPASWHFSLSSHVLPRILQPSFRQLLLLGLVLCLVGLLYLMFFIGKGHTIWTKEESHFHRHLARVTSVEATDTSNPTLNYGLVVDCGSSGSRVFVYCWPRHNGNPHELLDIRQMRDQHRKPVVMKIKPGISELATSPEKSSDYIYPLLSFAAQHIPKNKHQETPLYILCTAGMRLLPESQQEAILEDLRTDIPVVFNFLFSDSHVEVISGKQEGVYAWIGINFVLGRFNHVHNGKRFSRCLPLVLNGSLLKTGRRRPGRSGGAAPRRRPTGGAGEKENSRRPRYGGRVHADSVRSAQNRKLCFSTTGGGRQEPPGGVQPWLRRPPHRARLPRLRLHLPGLRGQRGAQALRGEPGSEHRYQKQAPGPACRGDGRVPPAGPVPPLPPAGPGGCAAPPGHRGLRPLPAAPPAVPQPHRGEPHLAQRRLPARHRLRQQPVLRLLRVLLLHGGRAAHGRGLQRQPLRPGRPELLCNAVENLEGALRPRPVRIACRPSQTEVPVF
ncbi:ectonucleoside triphosphate diphosphohydrolase 4 isoform X3 [Gadus macrocephalus]|uniref:ectonucleoside triphosphate diphosphohydrolase 4 isoform X3 n=1 Tax=Gadus macrocephalus TaxID=80720 RepID=UPI0028CB2951|nr:ectonucleoside triphosphate diphosphohydrolase 4 isoform X3 [Gadus macrocephalus]